MQSRRGDGEVPRDERVDAGADERGRPHDGDAQARVHAPGVLGDPLHLEQVGDDPLGRAPAAARPRRAAPGCPASAP